MQGLDMCLVFGPVISFIVSFLKRIPFVKNNPKYVTLFFSVAVSAFGMIHSTNGIDWSAVLACVLTQFSTGVATHEVVNTVQGKYSDGATAA